MIFQKERKLIEGNTSAPGAYTLVFCVTFDEPFKSATIRIVPKFALFKCMPAVQWKRAFQNS